MNNKEDLRWFERAVVMPSHTHHQVQIPSHRMWVQRRIQIVKPLPNVPIANNCTYRAAALQQTHTHTHIQICSLFVLCVPVWQMRCFCGVSADYHLPFIWGHEGAICYLDNEWCSLENLPITPSVEAVMRPTALFPWRPEARFLTPWTRTFAIVFTWVLLQLLILQLIWAFVSQNNIALNFFFPQMIRIFIPGWPLN